MTNVVLNHHDVVSDIVNSLGKVDPETLCTIYQMINDTELIYIGDDEFEIMELDDDEDGYEWDILEEED